MTRGAPRLVVYLPLEQPGTLLFDGVTLEDEHRLRAWLRRSSAFAELPLKLEELLDRLDDMDEHGRAA